MLSAVLSKRLRIQNRTLVHALASANRTSSTVPGQLGTASLRVATEPIQSTGRVPRVQWPDTSRQESSLWFSTQAHLEDEEDDIPNIDVEDQAFAVENATEVS